MRLRRTPEFERERTGFALAFTCEDCGHFDAARGRCRHEYPTEPHRAAAHPAEGTGDLLFCKEFELS